MAKQNPAIELILASSSPRRRELLAEAGAKFRVVEPPGEEPTDLGEESPQRHAEAVAFFKARSVAVMHPSAVVLGADTVVAVNGRILGKPIDAADARGMLETLSGTRHQVITGVALLGPLERRVIRSDTTYVTMKPMSEQDIQGYIDSLEWQGKAGAYAIQETADRYIEKVEGSFSNVVGLPMELTLAMLEEAAGTPLSLKNNSATQRHREKPQK